MAHSEARPHLGHTRSDEAAATRLASSAAAARTCAFADDEMALQSRFQWPLGRGGWVGMKRDAQGDDYSTRRGLQSEPNDGARTSVMRCSGHRSGKISPTERTISE